MIVDKVNPIDLVKYADHVVFYGGDVGDVISDEGENGENVQTVQTDATDATAAEVAEVNMAIGHPRIQFPETAITNNPGKMCTISFQSFR